jgi:hypothetical protein
MPGLPVDDAPTAEDLSRIGQVSPLIRPGDKDGASESRFVVPARGSMQRRAKGTHHKRRKKKGR